MDLQSVFSPKVKRLVGNSLRLQSFFPQIKGKFIIQIRNLICWFGEQFFKINFINHFRLNLDVQIYISVVKP